MTDPEKEVPQAIAIVGTTATGKTSLAIEVARRVDGEIISLDSRQAYTGFEIGTAAPTPEQRQAVPHHGVGFLAATERYGAGRFSRHASEWLSQIRARGRVPILAGGTGLFLRALTDPMFEEPPLDPRRRLELERRLGKMDRRQLRRWADRLDPEISGRLETLDRQRAGRTIELALLTGAPLSWWLEHGPPARPPLRPLPFLLELQPEDARERIRLRARTMIESGWKTEVEGLLAQGLEGQRAFNAVGYRDVAALVRGEIDEEEALARIFAATWGYARRQRTWFRHQLPRDVTALDGSLAVEQLARRVVEVWECARPREVFTPRLDRGPA